MKIPLLVLTLFRLVLLPAVMADPENPSFQLKTIPPLKPNEPKHAFFVGHFHVNTEINQMLAMADELKKINDTYSATFFVNEIFAEKVAKRGYPVIPTPSIPTETLGDLCRKGNDESDFAGYFKYTFNGALEFSSQFYEPTLKILKEYIDQHGKPDVMVASMFSDMAMDLANHYDIPLAINLACPLGGIFEYEAVPTAPDPLLWGHQDNYENFSYRLWKVVKFAKILSSAIPLSGKLNEIRAKYGLPAVNDPMENLGKAAWLTSWPLGFDVPRRLRPLTFMLGFVTDAPWTPPAEGLSQEDQELVTMLDEHEDGVLFCAFGSLAIVKQEWFDSIMQGIELWLKSQGPNAVAIVGMKNKMGLDTTKISSNVVMVEWTNQKLILAHENTKAFVTHCGQGSIAEGVHSQTPMFGFPIFGDQPANCHRLVHTGVGEMLHHREEAVTAQAVFEKLQKLTTDPKYKANLARHYQISARMGGAKKGASVIEEMMLLGHLDHLVPVEEGSGFVARNNLDVYAFCALMASLIFGGLFFVGYLLFKVLNRGKEMPKKVTKTD